jgi:flagellar biosynthetic protein FlhB
MADPGKTESATPKKRYEARMRGEVARSADLSSSGNLIVGISALGMFGVYLSGQLKLITVKTFSLFAVTSGEPAEMMRILTQTGIAALSVIAPILAAVLGASLIVNYLQVGFAISSQALTPKVERLNPLNGFKRIFSSNGTVELIKAFFKVIISGSIAWSVFSARLPEMIQSSNAPLKAGIHVAGSMLWEMAWKVGAFFLLLGLGDFFWQRYSYEQNLKMTKQEVRDEYRQAEGDPQVKSKRRARHRRLVQTRMAAEVARADVVTTNPTHYAVALRYDGKRMRAPKMVAKGQDYWAKRIVAVARKHHVPIIENKIVTRAMYKLVEVGQEIPPTLYRAVAEILAALYKLRARRGA